MAKALLEKLKEATMSILPISAIIMILLLATTNASGYVVGVFAIGVVLLILGLTIFMLGADIAMIPIGNNIGEVLSKTQKKKFWLIALIVFVIGFVVTIAEPDLLVLGKQLNSTLIIYVIGVGVGIFLLVSVMRTFFNLSFRTLLLIFYGITFILAMFVQIFRPEFLAVSFDSGGVTTGPITVPFIMALGIGLASVRGRTGKNNSGETSQEDSFGMVALCSVGPIIAVMLFGLIGGQLEPHGSELFQINSFAEMGKLFSGEIGAYFKEVAIAIAPILGIFILFQLFSLKLPKIQVLRIITGLIYTYIGLVIFLAGANICFTPVGNLIGASIAAKSYRYVLIPLGMVIGAVTVLAEPAIHILNKQVEEVTGGAISKRIMFISLCIGLSFAVGLAMLRALTGISIWWFLGPAYAAALILTFFVPKIFTGIAFDSGGVASGPMATALLLPLAIGVASSSGGSIYLDAFGTVAYIAMAPPVTIQIVGLLFKLKSARVQKSVELSDELSENTADMGETVDFIIDESEELVFELPAAAPVETPVALDSSEIIIAEEKPLQQEPQEPQKAQEEVEQEIKVVPENVNAEETKQGEEIAESEDK